MNTKGFIEKLNMEDGVAILEKIQAAGKNPEAVYSIAKETGVFDSFEVFQAEMENQYKAMASELSEEELLAVAGGVSKEDVGLGVAVGAYVGIISAGFAAA